MLVVVVMGQNCENTLNICMNSLVRAEKIIYCDGGSDDDSKKIAESNDAEIISNNWDPWNKQMNGKQRNFYLDYLKMNYPDDWALVLDADEMVEDIEKLNKFVKEYPDNEYVGFNVKMRHFIGDLGHEDATQQTHVVPVRLFKISKAKSYPIHSHPVLQMDGQIANNLITTIWHMGHLPVDYMRYISKRYRQHAGDSLIHSQEFLKQWRDAHLFGKYPTKEINPREIPSIIYQGMNLNPDEMYSIQEKLEMKHHLMVKQWYDYFKPDSVLELGCGRGCYLYYWNWFVAVAGGIEINKWAVNNAFIPGITLGDISDEKRYSNGWDLITAIDVLEHLDFFQLDKTLKNMAKCGKKFLFSIPFIGDPNLEADSTHIQKRTKEEWITLIEMYGIKIKETPKEWLFSNQILIGEK